MASAGLAREFALPKSPPAWALEAAEPPEARGLPRDGVRLLVSDLERASSSMPGSPTCRDGSSQAICSS